MGGLPDGCDSPYRNRYPAAASDRSYLPEWPGVGSAPVGKDGIVQTPRSGKSEFLVAPVVQGRIVVGALAALAFVGGGVGVLLLGINWVLGAYLIVGGLVAGWVGLDAALFSVVRLRDGEISFGRASWRAQDVLDVGMVHWRLTNGLARHSGLALTIGVGDEDILTPLRFLDEADAARVAAHLADHLSAGLADPIQGVVTSGISPTLRELGRHLRDTKSRRADRDDR